MKTLSFSLRRRSTVVGESQATAARQALQAVADYVRNCHEYDAEALSPRTSQTLVALEEVSRSPFSATSFHSALSTASRLMRQHDLWLGSRDLQRVAILEQMAALGYPVRDHRIEQDLAARSIEPEPDL